ncbi:MAG: hypothetical protein EWV55_14205 [Microcystis viridis Mv_BB_P_19951000_S69]|nr:MAG: hypothetical protein EWV47_20395 [Microcystis viridis Mv_BB_P_19951000_S68]TRU72734.1 MAG: hypothetical protein EWV55_14205 [Microcystis viridis Mv_BB_P_19951000_S69]TRU85824.1 MAG: hypothetical protein EWV46_11690 [Microcystis viridis Mv_BB_P_19951000_S69D]
MLPTLVIPDLGRAIVGNFNWGLRQKVFLGGRVWGVGCGVWGFTDFQVVNYLIFREKVQGFSP